jgi:prepilin-type N-terminal cleavage/methylation domain-containing protein
MGVRKKSKAGFTLIELLVVTAMMAMVGMVVTNLFFQTLKGANKAGILKEIKQNGDYTLSLMTEMIRNAKGVTSDCNGAAVSSIAIKNQDDRLTTFHCCGSPDFLIASESGGLVCSQARLTSNKVQVSSVCDNFITCTKTGSSPALVTISFSLSQAGFPTRPEEQATADFKTTVSLRTY